jgi:hypothetical protein
MVLSIMPIGESILPLGPNGNRAPQPPPPDKGGEGAGLQAAKRVEITFLENDFL